MTWSDVYYNLLCEQRIIYTCVWVYIYNLTLVRKEKHAYTKFIYIYLCGHGEREAFTTDQSHWLDADYSYLSSFTFYSIILYTHKTYSKGNFKMRNTQTHTHTHTQEKALAFSNYSSFIYLIQTKRLVIL